MKSVWLQGERSWACSYEDWKRGVDTALLARCGMTSDDLPDYAFHDAYDAGTSPDDVAIAMLELEADGIEDETGELRAFFGLTT